MPLAVVQSSQRQSAVMTAFTGVPKSGLTKRANASSRLGGGKRSTGSWSCASARSVAVVILSPLLQGDSAIVPIHENGDRNRQAKIDQHENCDALNGLAGLVHGRVGHHHEI